MKGDTEADRTTGIRHDRSVPVPDENQTRERLMNYFLLEISTTEPRQYRVTALGADVQTVIKVPYDEGFESMGMLTYPECMRVLTDHLNMENTK